MTIVRIGVHMLESLKKSGLYFLCLSFAAIGLQAQTFSVLASFNGVDGSNGSASGLIQGSNGKLYGTTIWGGTAGEGTAFEVSPQGLLSSIHNFCVTVCADGGFPNAGVVLATDGNFYGTTSIGGNFNSCTNGCGTIFRITQKGAETTLHSFDGADGADLVGGLIPAVDGSFYGTTVGYGPSSGGTVFRISRTGSLTTLHNFCSEPGCAEGVFPYAGLVQGSDGNFYGTTTGGGQYGFGTIFRITRTGIMTRIYSFCSQTNCLDGRQPQSSLVQGTDGSFYGTTLFGGNDDHGTIFRVTRAGVLTTLYTFCAQSSQCLDGASPYGGLMLATDGNFYGTTGYGGTACSPTGCGTLFVITPSGTLTTLHSFCGSACGDGFAPNGPLLQATSGIIYGTTEAGGVFTNCPEG